MPHISDKVADNQAEPSAVSQSLKVLTQMQGYGPSLAFKLIVASRIVVGLGEGVALPSMNNLVATLPKSLRSTGLGVAFTGFHSGQGPGAWPHTMPAALMIVPEYSVSTASLSIVILVHAGNLLGLAISPQILNRYGWRGLFCIFGILGGPLLAFWQAIVPARQIEGMMQLSQMPTIR